MISEHPIFTCFRGLTGCQRDPQDRGVTDMLICHLCQCQERLKAMLTYAYAKVELISINDGILLK